MSRNGVGRIVVPVRTRMRPACSTTLADWRAAERELLSLPEDDPLRPVVEAQVAELRGRYRELQAERQPGTVR